MTTRTNLQSELARFLAVGLVGAAIDLAAYLGLRYFGVPTYAAKTTSFLLGAVATYFGHKHVTFRRDTNGARSIVIYCLLYGSTLALNVAVNEVALWLLGSRALISLGIAWFVATATSAATNFVGGKLLVFNGAHRTVSMPRDRRQEGK